MKTRIFLGMVLAVSAAHADVCPDLRGTFDCGAFRVIATEGADAQGAPLYQFNSVTKQDGSSFDEMTADANEVPQDLGSSEVGGEAWRVSACRAGTLSTRFTSTMMNGLVNETIYSLNAQGDLTIQQGLHASDQLLSASVRVCARSN